jgi:hypothetical protein
MDKNPELKRCLTAGVILLCVGTVIIPSTAQDVEKSSLLTSSGSWLYVGGSGPGNYTRIQNAIANLRDMTMSESLRTDSAISVSEIPLISIDAVSAKAPENDDSRGFIIKNNFEVTAMEYGWENASGEVVWWGGPFIDSTVIGIGKHTIHITCDYSIYTYEPNVTQPQNGSFNYSWVVDLYLFKLYAKPVIHIKESYSVWDAFFLFKKGTWIGKLYIDGTLVKTEQFSIEH